MDGPHYLLVISDVAFQKQTGLCIILPTTSKPHPELGDLAVKLPALEGLRREGWVHLHHVRSIDFRRGRHPSSPGLTSVSRSMARS
jgi:mRNA-degrading endonuclease toxin of MazEF toxin-antitoxin module